MTCSYNRCCGCRNSTQSAQSTGSCVQTSKEFGPYLRSETSNPSVGCNPCVGVEHCFWPGNVTGDSVESGGGGSREFIGNC